MADATGAMDERITLQSLSKTPDGQGGTTEAWANFATAPTVWAKVTYRTAKEDMQEGRMNASQMVVFEIRLRNDVDELDGILWRGEFYNIRAIRRNGPRKMRMWIDAERGVAR